MADSGTVKNHQKPPLESNHVSLKSWIAVMGAMLGAFMAVLDIQITNASLKDIRPLAKVID